MIATTAEKQKYSAVNGTLGNSGDTMDCKATDADPTHGTSDYAASVGAMSKRKVPALGWELKSRLARTFT